MTSASDTGSRIILKPKPIAISRNLAIMGNPDMTLSPYESEIITVIVGNGGEARKFYIHKALTCEASPFFSRCLATEHFPEGRTKTVLLPVDSPAAFGVLLAFMYHGGTKLKDQHLVPIDTMFLAYILADKLCMKKACFAVLHHIMVLSDIHDVFDTTISKTLAEFPECAATNWMIAQVAWEFKQYGSEVYCDCDLEEDSTACGWCQFVSNGGPILVRILKAMKGIDDEGVNPSGRGAKYWIDQARGLQPEGGGDAHE